MSAWGTEVLKGRKIEINIDMDGMFYATLDGSKYRSQTLAGLKTRLRVAVMNAWKPIPCTLVSDDRFTFTDGEVIGYDDHTNKAKIKTGNEEFEQERFGSRELCRRLTKQERAKLKRFKLAKDAAEEAFETYWRSLILERPEKNG